MSAYRRSRNVEASLEDFLVSQLATRMVKRKSGAFFC